MFLADYHIHSSASYDAEDTMLAMALASSELGVENICFTDHCDLDDYRTGEFFPDYGSVWARTTTQYMQVRMHAPAPIDVRLGIELGEANHYPELASAMVDREELDFVLASTHNLRGTPDFYALKYESEEHCRELLDLYLDELMETAELDCFDVMSHIGYCRRYMLRAGFDVHIDLEHYGDKVEALLKRLIERGKGIEINCSGFRHPGIAGPIPTFEIIKLYRELGGEIITVGSDAHRVTDAGLWIKEGYALLKAAGFKYVTLFKKRACEYRKI